MCGQKVKPSIIYHDGVAVYIYIYEVYTFTAFSPHFIAVFADKVLSSAPTLPSLTKLARPGAI